MNLSWQHSSQERGKFHRGSHVSLPREGGEPMWTLIIHYYSFYLPIMSVLVQGWWSWHSQRNPSCCSWTRYHLNSHWTYHVISFFFHTIWWCTPQAPTHGPMMSPTMPQVSSLLVLAALGLAFIVSGPWTPWVPLGVPLGLSTAPGRPGSCGSWRCKDFRSEHYRNTNITNVRMNLYI